MFEALRVEKPKYQAPSSFECKVRNDQAPIFAPLNENEALSESEESLFCNLPECCLKGVVAFLDVVSLCRVDTSITKISSRKLWLTSLEGARSKALSAYPRYTNIDGFKGLRWAMRRKITLEKFDVTISKFKA